METLIEKEKPFLDKFLDRTALRIEEIIKSHKIRDWTQSQDVTNHIINDIEDNFYNLKGRYELDNDFGVIETMINQLLAIAVASIDSNCVIYYSIRPDLGRFSFIQQI